MTRVEAIAQIVSGEGEAPNWLVPNLRTARDTLAWSIRTETQFPERAPLLRRLRALVAAAEFVRLNLRDIDISTMLLDGDPYFLNQNDMFHGLGDVARRANRFADGVPVRPGRDKFFGRPDGLRLQTNCALMIGIIWQRARGDWPPASHEPAQDACSMMWAQAGGQETNHWGTAKNAKSVKVWRDHLRDAKKAQTSPEARHLAAFLGQG